MANITGIPESADMSSYDFLKDNICGGNKGCVLPISVITFTTTHKSKVAGY